MSFYNLLILQIIGHVLADFIFQNDKWIQERQKLKFRSKVLYWHTLIIFILSWGLSLQWKFVYFSIAITISHFILDGFKMQLSNITIAKNKLLKKGYFFIDQTIHIVIIAAVTYWFNHKYCITSCYQINADTKHLLIAFGYLICLKPTNIIIKEVLSLYSISIDSKPDTDLLNAGKLIGNIERIITLTLILFNQFSVVGFIIAAKSIIRFKDTDKPKTEYVLIGSLLSFGIAILMGISIEFLKICLK